MTTIKTFDRTDHLASVLSHEQLTRLQKARDKAGWGTIEAYALDVAINIHIGAPNCQTEAMRFLHNALAQQDH